MTRYLVTGGTGFLGEHVAKVLLAQGDSQVRLMARAPSLIFDDHDVDFIQGDVLDARAVAKAMDGCEAVFHMAGVVSRDPDDSQRMMRVHVDGTRHVLEAAHSAGVKRIVIASTSGTVAVSQEEHPIDESAGYATEVVAGWPYYASKIYQEKLALEEGARFGVEVVVVNPSLLLGPGDRRLSSTSDVLKFLRGKLPIVPSGGLNFVDVRDAAEATVQALDRGRPGERYLLGGPNWSFEEFFGRLGRIANVGRPRLKLPGAWARAGATVVEELWRAAGREPPFDRISVEMAQHYWYVDSSKAERELGFVSREPSLTLTDTVRFLRAEIDAEI